MPHYPKPFYRRARQRWYVQIDGKQYNLGPDRELAFLRYRDLMARPKHKPVAGDSVAAIIDAFLEWTQNHRAPATYGWYLERTQAFVRSNPALTVEQLKPYHVQQWVDSHPAWSNGHKRGCITAVQRAFRWAMKMGYIDHSPITYVEKPPAGKRDQIVSDDEYAALLELFPDQPFQDLLVTSWETGARPQESLRLEARHVDVVHHRWVFPTDESKTKKFPRVVYLSDRAFEITRRLMLKRPQGPLFRNTRGRPWNPYAVNCRFCRAAKKLGTKYCLYNFRHSFATRMLERGVDSLTVSVLLGHVDTSMLSRVYAHLTFRPEFLLNAVRRATA